MFIPITSDMEEDDEAPIPPTPPRQRSPAPREPSPAPREPSPTPEREPVEEEEEPVLEKTSSAKESTKGDKSGERKRKRTKKRVNKTYMDKDGFMGKVELHAGLLCMLFLSSADTFFEVSFFQKFFQEYYQSIKQFGSRSGQMFCRSLSGSKLFSKVISRRQKMPLALGTIYMGKSFQD